MIRASGTIRLADGSGRDFEAGPVEWVAWERYAIRQGLPVASEDVGRAAPVTMSLYLAYTRLTRGVPVKDRAGFETWIEDVAGIEGFTVESADPTRAAASPGASSSSLTSPDSPPPSSPAGTLQTSPP